MEVSEIDRIEEQERHEELLGMLDAVDFSDILADRKDSCLCDNIHRSLSSHYRNFRPGLHGSCTTTTTGIYVPLAKLHEH